MFTHQPVHTLPCPAATSLSPLTDQSKNASIADAVLQKLDQPRMVNRIKETFHISIQYPVHLLARDRNAQGIKCLMLAASRAEAIAAAEPHLLVNALQYPQHCLLDNLVI